MGASDAAFEHTAAPDGDAFFLGGIVDGYGLTESSDAAVFDVDDAAGLHINGGQRITAVADGFIQADGRSDAFLQHGVVVEVVVPERLLDHEQVEGIESGQVIEIVEAVGGVGVATEQNFGPAVAHFSLMR